MHVPESTLSHRPVVGIIADRIELHGHAAHSVLDGYIRALSEVSRVVPIILPAARDAFDNQALLSTLDGVMLTGSSSNVAAEQYGAPPLPASTHQDLHRDAVVLGLLPALIEGGLPILGICRGFQELNVLYGGTLERAVHEQSGRLDHREGNHDRPIQRWYDDSHAVRIVPGGTLEKLAGTHEVMVNSLHHQGVDRLGSGLTPEAFAPDGLVEAFSIASASQFTLAVQWHPEMRVDDCRLSRAIFTAFGNECRSYHSERQHGNFTTRNATPTPSQLSHSSLTVPTHDIRALFGRSYAEAREIFCHAAALRGLSVDSFILPLKGVDGETLATDVVFDGAPNASRLVILISGVHGVEGYCGSAIQTGVLGMGPVAEPDTAILFIHAVNPYGFSYSRRSTQENVDLNRNFVDFSRALPVNEQYAEIHDLLLPVDWPASDENEDRLGALQRRWGARGYQRAISLGQYAFSDGLHFGGHEPTWSNTTFRDILRKYAQRCRRIGSIDIHTGLGPYGVGERIFACPDETVTLARAQRWWGNGITSVNTGTSTSIPITGPIQYGQFEECPQAEQTNVCLEFGTHPISVIFLAMRAEHWLHRHGSHGTRNAAAIRQALKDAFYPQADDWQADIWRQGREVFLQTVQGLQDDRQSNGALNHLASLHS